MENMVNKKDSFFRIVLNKLKQLGRFIVDDCIKFPAYILTHPLKGFEEFKRYKKGKMSVALLFVILLIFVNILKFQYDGFLVNNNNIKDLNTFAQVAYVAGAVFVATIGNWAVTTLFDGKGNMKEIFMMVCYCLYPLIWSTSVGIILSNILTEDEMAIYNSEKEKAIKEAKQQVYSFTASVEIGICAVYTSAIFLEKKFLYEKAI